MKKHLLFILIIGFILLFIFCQQQKTIWKGTIEEKDGVIIIKNPKEPIYGEDIFSLTEDLSIGRAEGQVEYMFSRISSIDVDDEENVYVADSVSAHIKVFDRHGQYIRTIGRRGQGPGEMQMPYCIQITSKNELLVQDRGARRLLFYALNGDFLRQDVSGRTGFSLLIKMDSYGNFIGMVSLAPPPVGGKIFQKYDPDFNIIKTIAEEKQGKRGVFDIGKTSCYCDVSPSDNIIWGDSKEYVLQILNPQGVLIKRIIKDSNPLRFTEKDKEMYEQRYAEPIQAGYELKLPSHFPAFKDIFVDEKERIFV
ncbi:MAG: 6-bladed beta-propeller, partial [Candidatus Aminicenantaceae bacterium]